MELTSAQRKFLRSAARTRKPNVTIGKGGSAGGVISHISGQLDRLELVKVRLLESASDDRKAAAEEIAQATGAALIDVVGRMIVLYRPNEKLPPAERVHLPG